MLPVVSVIVPVYNGQATLQRCLDSLKNQEYANYEVIVINDGSCDESAALAQKYEQSDSRFCLVNQENRGVAVTRNRGIELARGEFLMFVDCDDFVEKDFLLAMTLAMTQDVDMAICDYQQNDEIHGLYNQKHFAIPEGEYDCSAYIEKVVSCPGAHYIGVLWNKIYRKSLIQEWKMSFPEQASLGEDFVFNMKYLAKCRKIRCISAQFYQYAWQNPDSLCVRKKPEEVRIRERVRMYRAYEQMLAEVQYHDFWNLQKHYYIAKAYFDELDYLEGQANTYKKVLYQSFIRDSQISVVKFWGFWMIKKLKQLKKRIRK